MSLSVEKVNSPFPNNFFILDLKSINEGHLQRLWKGGATQAITNAWNIVLLYDLYFRNYVNWLRERFYFKSCILQCWMHDILNPVSKHLLIWSWRGCYQNETSFVVHEWTAFFMGHLMSCNCVWKSTSLIKWRPIFIFIFLSENYLCYSFGGGINGK